MNPITEYGAFVYNRESKEYDLMFTTVFSECLCVGRAREKAIQENQNLGKSYDIDKIILKTREIITCEWKENECKTLLTQNSIDKSKAVAPKVSDNEPIFVLWLATTHVGIESGNNYRLALPASNECLVNALAEICVGHLNDCRLVELECTIDGLQQLLPLDNDLESLNELAIYISDEFTAEGYTKFKAMMEVERPGTYKEAYTLATDFCNYDLCDKDVELPEDYGAHVLYYSGRAGQDFDFQKEVADFIRYDKYGAYRMKEDGVRATSYGFLRRIDHPFSSAVE